MEPWQACLLTQATEIVRNNKGKLEFHVTERQEGLSIQILAGKRYDFGVRKTKIEEED